ncbi:MAG: YqiA/YcfP family alpha/beta fold hydrolase [Kofleriaceae bacterium]
MATHDPQAPGGAPPSVLRVLYLHGFASGPASTKGVAFERFFAAHGIVIERLDLRRPSLQHLRLSSILATVDSSLEGAERVVLIGSSLGGLAAARVAERDPRVVALVLLAPAFRLMERWRARLGEEEWEGWRQRGWLEVHDFTTDRPTRVDFGFAEDAAAIDAAGDGWPRITVPTLMFHGLRDDVVDIGLSRQVVARHPEVRLLELNDDHQLVDSLPRLLTETYEFLIQHGA